MEISHCIDFQPIIIRRSPKGAPLPQSQSSGLPYQEQSTLRISDPAPQSLSPHSTPNLSSRRRSSDSEVKFLPCINKHRMRKLLQTCFPPFLTARPSHLSLQGSDLAAAVLGQLNISESPRGRHRSLSDSRAGRQNGDSPHAPPRRCKPLSPQINWLVGW